MPQVSNGCRKETRGQKASEMVPMMPQGVGGGHLLGILVFVVYEVFSLFGTIVCSLQPDFVIMQSEY